MISAGDVLAGRYRLIDRVGGGGMGDVWRGEDIVLHRTVAVKVLLAKLAAERGFQERFRREARAIAALKGPGIVDVYDYGETRLRDADVSYLVMQLVDGLPLSRRLAEWGRLHVADTLGIVAQVGDALQIAHEAGIVHRDIKPGNILVRDDGHVVLVDFGIARASGNRTLTTTGVVLGTVTYMSPEQASGEPLTAHSDVYSLGVVAHQCLSGRPPFKADTPLEVLSAHLREEPPPVPPDVPYRVYRLINRALAKDPAQRWPSAGAFAAACRAHQAEPATLVGTGAGHAHHTGPRPSRRPPSPRPATMPPTPPPTPPAAGPPGPVPAGTPSAQMGRPSTAAILAAEPTGGARHDTGGHRAGVLTRRRDRRLRITVVAAIVLALLGGVGAAARPWESPLRSETTSGRPGAEGPAQVDQPRDGADDGQDGAGVAPPVPGETGTSAPTATPSPNESASAPPVDRPTSPGPESSAAPSSPTPSAPTSSPATAPVPNVMNMSETGADRTIRDAGFRPNIGYTGDGDTTCGVTDQQPPGGTQAEPQSVVSVTVQRVAGACP